MSTNNIDESADEETRLKHTLAQLVPLRDMADRAGDQFVAYALEMVIVDIEERLSGAAGPVVIVSGREI